MKISFASFFILCFFFISCTKNTTDKVASGDIYYSEKVDSTSLSGTWILVSKSGGFAGTTIIDTDIYTISFDKSGTYQTSLNNSSVESGTYTIGLEKTIYYSDKTPVIYFTTAGRTYFNAVALSNDSLSLSDNNYDGFSGLYKKLQ